MSFLRRLALKSVMAAKKELVCRPDGANTMIKTIQYLAEADSSRVLVALDLKAAFQNGQAADAVTCSQSRYIGAYRGKKEEPWQLPETRHQSQSRSRLFKRSRVSTLLTQNHRRQRRPSCRAFSCLKWLSLSLPHSERCHDSVNQDHLACVRYIGMTFGSLAGNSTCLCK